MPSALITGANRGLGLEFVRQLAEKGWTVHATCRRPDQATALQELAGERVQVHALDVGDFAAVDALAQGPLAGASLDLLLSNAGLFGNREGFGDSDWATWERTFRINALAPMKLAEAFVEHVARSERKLIANMTSKMGSIGDNTSGSMYVYRSTKAALNMINKSLALDLRSRGITCVVLHPGWVVTDMGGPSAPVRPPESIRGMLSVLEGLSRGDTGKFFDYTGAELPW